jgi:phosphoribosylanthranilate isomerase
MSVWIKICGNTSLADARLAVGAGADAVGFVFASSPRQVTQAQAASICSQLPSSVEKIGVFVDTELKQVFTTVRACGLTGVQLHFDASPEFPVKLREMLGPALRIVQVTHFESGLDGEFARQLSRLAHDPHIDAVLVDSRTATAVGGTGVAFDWTEARRTAFAAAGKLKLIAAGGLSPANVAEAVAALHPWGVDVVSGVESAPGEKDPLKVREFVARARAEAEYP